MVWDTWLLFSWQICEAWIVFIDTVKAKPISDPRNWTGQFVHHFPHVDPVGLPHRTPTIKWQRASLSKSSGWRIIQRHVAWSDIKSVTASPRYDMSPLQHTQYGATEEYFYPRKLDSTSQVTRSIILPPHAPRNSQQGPQHEVTETSSTTGLWTVLSRHISLDGFINPRETKRARGLKFLS